MGPTPTSSSAAAQPLPPLPDLSAGPKGGGSGEQPGIPPSFLASIMSGIAPVKRAVDQINQACREIVQSGAIPGAEAVCSQIVSAANSLLPMAAQNALQPGMGSPVPGGGAAASGGGLSAGPPPPGPPGPLPGQGQ